MQHLRSKEHGCPWDKQQNYASLIPFTLEEAYEVADAIEQGAIADLRLELGDLLFQVVFYAQIAKEEGRFDFSDVIQGITDKLLRRHPHVFPDGTLASAGSIKQEADEQSIKANWERIKAEEKPARQNQSVLDDVPLSAPALARAHKIQSKAARVGFDWPEVSGALAKLYEEIAELEEAMSEGNAAQVADELGDLMFSCVNLARHLQVNAETAMRAATQKFERRFRIMESQVHADQRTLREMNLEELEAAWQLAKSRA